MTERRELARRVRDYRDYRETYGRGGGERFEEEYPRSYATPGRMDWRRALRAYVDGHDRGREADRKYRDAGSGEEAGAGEEEEGFPGDEVESTPGARPRFGVPVPDALRFHRGASVWRDRLPAPRRPVPREGD